MSPLLSLAHIKVKFILDGKKYEVERFKIGFAQPTDHKGQPQHEIQGGQITVTLSHIADDNLYRWAKTSTDLKNGSILFQTDMGITVLEVTFLRGYCVNLTREINASNGTSTSLIISSDKVTMNGIEHNNYWEL